MQEPYQTDAYDRFPGEDAFFTPYRVTVMSPSLLQACSSSSPGRTDLPNELLAAFDTNKVAKRGTLQRLKMRNREEHSDDRSETIDEVSDVDMEDQEHGKYCFRVHVSTLSIRNHVVYSTPPTPVSFRANNCLIFFQLNLC